MLVRVGGTGAALIETRDKHGNRTGRLPSSVSNDSVA